jgi:hypothetical protein
MRHPLGGLEPDTTFRCERCGQKLLVPSASAVAAASSRPSPPASTGPAGVPDPSPTSPAPPRRRTPGAAVPNGAAAAGVAVTVSANGEAALPTTDSRRSRRAARPERRRVHWYWRLLAWIVAVPLGFVIAVIPSYEFGVISKDDVLDVFVGSGTDRYVRLGVVTLIWAVVTAILVQLFVEVGRWWAGRRRRHREEAGRGRRGGGPVPVGSA